MLGFQAISGNGLRRLMTARRRSSRKGETRARAADFKRMVIDYIERRFGQAGAGRTAAE
jgi:hypothetical protein